MELGRQIKKYRTELKWSQEELAENAYVSRQTVSNWENEKNYPDIHSLLILSNLFNVSLDELIKGDVEVMKNEINKEEIKKFTSLSAIFAVMMIVMTVSAIPLVLLLHLAGAAIWLAIVGVTIYFAFRVEKVKKNNNIQTYKEIIAFVNGERLDEIASYREEGKRVYQKILMSICSGVIAFIICMIMFFIIGIFT